MTELDLAFVSGNWRGLNGRIERALNESGCYEGNWTAIVADVFGYSESLLERSYSILKCDPRRSLSWFNTARSALKTGDKETALRIAREGSEVAPGSWLYTILIRALVANGLHDEARQIIDNRIKDRLMALPFMILVAAHKGDRSDYDKLIEQARSELVTDKFWLTIAAAWGGDRETANRLAAEVDQHFSGPTALVQIAQWCDCGAPWDLDATPNFAAKIDEGKLAWPPRPAMAFPLKDW